MNFKGAKNKAQRIAVSKEKLLALLRSVVAKLQKTEDRNELVGKAKDKINTFVRMIRAYAKGEYKEIPWKTIVLVTAGLIYFVNPFDVVPDFIPVAGLMDDVAIILWIFNTIDKDLVAFTEWEETTGTINID